MFTVPTTARDHATPSSSAAFETSPRNWSRRSFLGALSALAAGAAAGCSFTPAERSDFSSGGGPLAAGRKNLLGDVRQPAAIQAVCELSEDYFLVTNHQLDPTKDTVVAYSRADGEVEGLVLQDGVVKQVYRDPSQAGGWNVSALPDANGVAQMTAGVSGPVSYGGAATPAKTPAVLKVFYTRPSNPGTLYVASETKPAADGTAPTFTTTTVPWGDVSLPLQISVNYDNSVLVCAMQQSTSTTAQDGKLFFYTESNSKDRGNDAPAASFGALTGFSYHDQSSPLGSAGWSAVVVKVSTGGSAPINIMLSLPSGTYGDAKSSVIKIPAPPSVNMWLWPVVSGHTDGVAMSSAAVSTTLPPAAPGKPTAFSIESSTVLGAQTSPTLLVRTLDADSGQRLWVVAPDQGTWTWNELALPSALDPKAPVVLSTAMSPVPAAEKNQGSVAAATGFLDVFVVVNEALYVIRQAPTGDAITDKSQPAYTPVIPLQPQVAAMTSQAGRSNGNELLLVGTDGTLQTLTKDPATGHWSDSVLHLPSGELQQVSAYRVELSVIDDWGNGIGGQDVKISSSTPVSALIGDQAVALGPEPVGVATDAQGEVVLAMIADGLSAPTLTVASDNVPSASVNPAAPLNTYMQGKSSLNYQDPLDADTLKNAQTPDGRLVAPGASDGSAAAGAVDQMSTAATWATSPNLTSARRSASLARRDGQLRGQLADGKTITAKGVLSDVNAWFHDAAHAIKKGAVAVKNVAYDVASKTFTLAADFAQWAKQAVTVVVRGLEDAAHVFHAVLNKLGAAILNAVKWLEAEVLGVLKDTAALAHDYDGWIIDATGFLGKQLISEAAAVDAWLAARQATLKVQLTQLACRFSKSTSLTTLGANPPGAACATKATRKSKSLTDDPDPDTSEKNPHSNWLWHKVKHGLLGELNSPQVDGMHDLVGGLHTAVTSALGDFSRAFGDFKAFLETLVKHPSDVGTLGVQDLLNAVAELVDGMFTLFRGVVVAVMKWFAQVANAIPTMISTPLSALPVVGKLLALVGLGSIKLGTIITMLMAFPAALAWKIAHKGKGRPFATATTSRSSGNLGDDASDLQICAGASLSTWAIFDSISALSTAAGEEPPMIFSIIDIVAPLVVTATTVPTTKGGQPYYSAPITGDQASQMNFGSWVLGALPAFVAASTVLIDKYYPNEAAAKEWKSSLVWLTGAGGVFALATGCIGNDLKEEPEAADYAGAVLNNMALIVAPMLEFGGVSALIVSATTLVCGVTGGLVYGFDG